MYTDRILALLMISITKEGEKYKQEYTHTERTSLVSYIAAIFV